MMTVGVDGKLSRAKSSGSGLAPVDLELLADLLHELVERGGEAMHRQYYGRAQRLVISETPSSDMV
jgi:hypothetical protein